MSAVYDKNKDVIELIVTYTNTSADGISNYYYAVDSTGNLGFKPSEVRVKEKFNDPLFSVVQISNVKHFKEITLLFAPQVSDDISEIKDEDTGEFVITKDNITRGKILDKSKSQYLKTWLDIQIKNLVDKKAIFQNKIAKKSEQIKNLETENEKLKNSLGILTGVELDNANYNINNNSQKIEILKGDIEKYNLYVRDYNKQIKIYKENKTTL